MALTGFYDSLLAAGRASREGLSQFLRAELPRLWMQAYGEMRADGANVVAFWHGTFEYIYDHYDVLEQAQDPVGEPRLVAAIGISAPKSTPRDDYRLRGWVGPTGRLFGSG